MENNLACISEHNACFGVILKSKEKHCDGQPFNEYPVSALGFIWDEMIELMPYELQFGCLESPVVSLQRCCFKLKVNLN